MVLLASPAARAAPLDDALARFAADSFPETEKAIEELAASGEPQVEALLRALADRRLMVSASEKTVFYSDETGKLFDARTAQPASRSPDDLSAVRVNNRLRNVIQGVLSSLALFAADPRRRMQAAESIFKSQDADALTPLETALAKEKDTAVRRMLEEARASVMLMKPDAGPADRLAAISILADRGDRIALGQIRSLMGREVSPEVRAAAEDAIERIEARLQLLGMAQNVWYGISLGSVLLLAAIGLAITFGVMGVINMAHGEMVMLGAYTTFVVQEVLRAYAPEQFDWSLPLAVPLAFLVAALVGIAIERGVIRMLYSRPLETLLATWGISLILQQAVRSAFGSSNRQVGAPSYMSGAFDVYGLSITYGRLCIVVFTLVVFTSLVVVLKTTPLGLQMRAVTQNRRMASAMGIRTGFVDAMTFGLGSGIAGIAGVALSQIDNVSPNLGQSYIIDSFMVVVFGGVGNLWGTFVSAFALGIANKFLEPIAGAVLGKILILVLLILFIQKRPRGLFALKGRAVEA
ncbi:MAG TPA: urea ABC transporter permease subunit UrtB [Hyphomicrobiaceae bacterium]|nr:urea ABC transporter permease subunit UrtB [Hyphomicrobiaceae bacterium]